MAKVQVIGESCTDIFVYCDAIRLAPDLPVPILEEIHIDTNPGMASNVLRNLQARSIQSELVTNENWNSITKTRFVHDRSNHTFFRVDTPFFIQPIKRDVVDLNADILVISDYNKGFISEADIAFFCKLHPLVFLDTKKILGTWAEDATFIKVNNYEFKNSQQTLTKKLLEKIIVTKGEDGCDYLGVNYPVERFEIRDTSGAGDSFLAALVAEYSIGYDIIQSIKAANIAASKVVRTRGVGTI